MIRFFAAHPTAANLLMILLLAMGVFAIPSLRRETFPKIPPKEIEIQVVYPGAATADVEDSICGRIEDAIDSVEGIEEVRSEAMQSVGKVTVEIASGADPRVVLDDLRTEVEAIDDFPERVEDPIIRQLGRTDKVAAIAVTGDLAAPDLKALCELLRRTLLQDDEVEIVDILGFSDHQLRVEIPMTVLLQFGLSAADIANAIESQNIDLPAGEVQTPDGDVLIRFTDERRTPAELEQLVVLVNDTGAEITLGDIATVQDRFELDEAKLLYNGRRAGLLDVKKTEEQDSLTVFSALERFVEEESQRLPPGCLLAITQDQSSIVGDRLSMLIKNGWQGLLLVFFTLWLFFSFRLSFWVAAGLPVSFMGAFFFMELIGYSLNMMTLVALLLALGLLMDDSIVLAENVATHRRNGKSPLRAAIDGVTEVRIGILSSFATTLAVFVPLSFLDGDIGSVLKVIPVVLILVLSVSLIEAFMILPAHLGHALHGTSEGGRFRDRFDQALAWVRERLVGRAADAFVRHRYLAVGVALAALIGSIGMIPSGHLKFQALPAIDGDVIVARVLLPQGTALSRTEEVVDEITQAFDRVNEHFRPRQPDGADLKQSTTVQYNVNADAYETGPHVATVTIDLLSAEVRDAPLDDVLGLWRDEVGAVPDVISLRFTEPAFGPAGRPIEIRIQGDDLDRCTMAARETRDWLVGFDGVFDVFDDLRPGKRELRVHMKPGGRSLGVSARDVSSELRAAFFGETVGEVRVGGEDYEIDSRFAASDRDSIADVEDLRVTQGDGSLVHLSSVAEIEEGRGYARIARVDSIRTVTVQGEVNPAITNVSAIMGQFQNERLPSLQDRFPDLTFSIEGEVANGAETGASLARAFLIGILLIFLLLSFQFRSYVEPLIVMLAIPMCLIGVVWGHLLLGLDLTMPSMLGFVSLAGVVVNDSILLVEFIKTRRREGEEIQAAAQQASRLRFRAVLLTSVTTIVGMLPLLSETSMQAQVLIPLAVSIVFGLMVSTVLVLLLLPAIYTILGDLGLASKVEASTPD